LRVLAFAHCAQLLDRERNDDFVSELHELLDAQGGHSEHVLESRVDAPGEARSADRLGEGRRKRLDVRNLLFVNVKL